MLRGKKVLSVFLFIFMVLQMYGICAEARTITVAKDGVLENVMEAEAPEGNWVREEDGTKFQKSDGTYVTEQWIKVNEKAYYMDMDGNRVLGWVQYNDKLYYINKKGAYIGWKSGKYYFGQDAVLATGLATVDGAKYYFDPASGVLQKGWKTLQKKTYYFLSEDGRMAKNVWVRDGSDYKYVNKKGILQKKKWLNLGEKTYYVDSKGARATGDRFIDGKWCRFDSKGVYDPNYKFENTVDPTKKMVALTFDDGPGPYTMRLLQCLKENGARATFFMVGTNVMRYRSTVKEMADMGCELGNHSYDHTDFTTLSVSGIQSQVSRTSSLIKSASGKSPTLCRLPYGSGASNYTVVNALGLPSIYWSIDTRDWANLGNPSHTVNEVLNNVQSGDIVLMHDCHLSTVQAAERIIPALKSRGYQMVTVSELAKYKKNKVLKAGTTYYHFK